MARTTDLTDLPLFLRSAEAFSGHLEDQFSDSSSLEKGDSFVGFACKIVPFCDFWRDYDEPTPSSKKTHDQGVDFDARHRSGSGRLIGQSKYRMRDVAAFDSVLSKFSAYAEARRSAARVDQQNLFHAGDVPGDDLRFVLVTASNLSEIRRRYEESRLPSLGFYRGLVASQRLHILDGVSLLVHLQSLYRQSYLIASQIEVEFARTPLEVDNVLLSVVSGPTLQRLYSEYGSSLFFENIREFYGIAGEGGEKDASVNAAILDTLRQLPTKMLGRNNGITFRADAVESLDGNRLRLLGGSIVNGCQTTMCVVNAGVHAEQAMIATKIVVGDDSWEVAKSANYQNRVTRIDLELARFLRPQYVRKIATDLGYGLPVTHGASISNVLDDIHRTKISYDAIKLLYLGVFSRHPNNLFEGVYSEVRIDVLQSIHEQERHPYVMRVLLKLLEQMKHAAEALQERYHDEHALDVFRRFFQPHCIKYQCLLAILTACGCVTDDLVDKPANAETACARILAFIGRLDLVLMHHGDYFDRVFRCAFLVVAQRVLGSKGDTQELLQKMFKEVVSASGVHFRNQYDMLRLQMLNDDYIAGHVPDFGTAD